MRLHDSHQPSLRQEKSSFLKKHKKRRHFLNSCLSFCFTIAYQGASLGSALGSSEKLAKSPKATEVLAPRTPLYSCRLSWLSSRR